MRVYGLDRALSSSSPIGRGVWEIGSDGLPKWTLEGAWTEGAEGTGEIWTFLFRSS